MFQSILEGQVGSSTEIAYFVWLAEWESRIVVVVGGGTKAWVTKEYMDLPDMYHTLYQNGFYAYT